MRQPPFDLFGDVPVTEQDVFDWVAAVSPRWLTPEHSFHYYVRSWSVVERIKAAKIAGTFESSIAQRAHPWHARLALAAVL